MSHKNSSRPIPDEDEVLVREVLQAAEYQPEISIKEDGKIRLYFCEKENEEDYVEIVEGCATLYRKKGYPVILDNDIPAMVAFLLAPAKELKRREREESLHAHVAYLCTYFSLSQLKNILQEKHYQNAWKREEIRAAITNYNFEKNAELRRKTVKEYVLHDVECLCDSNTIDEIRQDIKESGKGTLSRKLILYRSFFWCADSGVWENIFRHALMACRYPEYRNARYRSVAMNMEYQAKISVNVSVSGISPENPHFEEYIKDMLRQHGMRTLGDINVSTL